MNKRVLVIASMVALAATAGTAQADVIAGWDFSQYFTAGRLTIDGTTFVDTLDANYSNLDPTGNAGGVESASKGTMFIDGSFMSSDVDPAPANATVTPAARRVGDYGVESTGLTAGRLGIDDITVGEGLIESNKTVTVDTPTFFGEGSNEFNSFSILRTQGQANTELLSLLATAQTTVVFQADATSHGGAQGWSVSFGGRSLDFDEDPNDAGSSATVAVSFAPDCSGFGTATNVTLTEDDQAFAVAFDPNDVADSGCVRMVMDATAAVDNVAVEATPVPEPGVALGLAACAAALAALHRRRS